MSTGDFIIITIWFIIINFGLGMIDTTLHQIKDEMVKTNKILMERK